MALVPLTTIELMMRIKPGDRIASMGYPDFLCPLERIEPLFAPESVPWSALQFRNDSEKICKWHGLDPRPIPDSASLFGLFGATLDVFDIVQARGGEILCDLNSPINHAHCGQYDFVLDVGTIEHCFNIGTAARNMASLLKPGGVIFHGNPFNSGNHGFYGLQPTWFADFYGQEGFKLLYCKLMARGSDEPLDVPLTSRFSCAGGEVNILAAAERTAIRAIGWPVQTKYRKMIAA